MGLDATQRGKKWIFPRGRLGCFRVGNGWSATFSISCSVVPAPTADPADLIRALRRLPLQELFGLLQLRMQRWVLRWVVLSMSRHVPPGRAVPQTGGFSIAWGRRKAGASRPLRLGPFGFGSGRVGMVSDWFMRIEASPDRAECCSLRNYSSTELDQTLQVVLGVTWRSSYRAERLAEHLRFRVQISKGPLAPQKWSGEAPASSSEGGLLHLRSMC